MNIASIPLCTLTQACGLNVSTKDFNIRASGSENGAFPGYSSYGSKSASFTPQSTAQFRLVSTPRPFLRSHQSPDSTLVRPLTFSIGTIFNTTSFNAAAVSCCPKDLCDRVDA